MKKMNPIKRRGVETIFQKIGVSDGTLDTEFEDCKRRFDRTIRERGELSQGMGTFLERTRDLYSTGMDLADITYEYYWGRLMMDWPPGTPTALRAHPVAAKYKQAWSHCNEAVRRSASKVWVDHGLSPLRAFMSSIVPEIQHEVDLRQAYVKDYDSYRRRFNALQDKQAKLAATPPANGGPNPKLAEVEKALYQIQSKLNAAEDRYRRQNVKVKDEMIKAKLTRDELLEGALRALVACQTELFAQTGEHLAQLVSLLPGEGKVETLQQEVKGLVAKGGPEVKPVELTQMDKLVKAVATGFTPRSPASPKAQGAEGGGSSSSQSAPQVHALATTLGSSTGRSDAIGTSASAGGDPPKSPQKPAGQGSATSGSNNNNNNYNYNNTNSNGIFSTFFRQPSGNAKAPGATTTAAGDVGTGYAKMEGSNSTAVVVTGPAVAAPPLSTGSKAPVLARALYDNEPEDETELGFVVGDTLEILTKDDSGWWEARLNGKVGSIPANYVEIISS